MLVQKFLLAAVAATTAFAGPCKPQLSKMSTIPSSGTSITSSTLTASTSGTTENTSVSNSGPASQKAPTSNTVTSLTTTDTAIAGSYLTERTSNGAFITETVTTDTTTTDNWITDTTNTGFMTTETTSTENVVSSTDAAFTDTTTTEATTSKATTSEAIENETPATKAVTTQTTTTRPATTVIYTTETTTAAFCSRSTALISELKDDPVISPFCVGYLSISTETSTKYETVGPSSVYKLELATVTAGAVTSVEVDFHGVTAVKTVMETKTEWDTSTTTRTRSTDTISCLNGAYTYTPPTVTVDRGNAQPRAFEERSGEGAVEIPGGFPDDWTEAQTSEACSCLSFNAPTTTTTILQTIAPTTLWTFSTDVVTPIEEYTKVITTTSVSTFTSTVTEKKTSTVTGWVVETTFANSNGVAYRRYDSDYNAVPYSTSFTPAYFKSRPVLASGSFTSLTFNGRTTLTLPGSDPFNPAQSAILFNGYFFAMESGIHTFVIPPDKVDNWGYLWVGDAAYAWNSNTWVIEATRTGNDPNLWKAGSYQVKLNRGDAIPFTYLWANGGGRAGSDVSVQTPSGKSLPGLQGSMVGACGLSRFQ